jgi:ParB/RepB/Spo0J family partition protein
MAKKLAKKPGRKPKSTKQNINDAPKKRGRKPTPAEPYDGPSLGLGKDTVKEIPLNSLHIEDETFQIRLTSTPDKSLLDSIRTHGIQIPLIVRHYPENNDEYQLVCGFRRANAAKSLEFKKIPAIVRVLTDEAAKIMAYTENEYRKTLRDLDRARAIESLRKSGKKTKQISALLRMSNKHVQRLEKMLDYDDLLKNALDEAETTITSTHALILWQAKKKYDGGFDLSEWIAIAKEQGSVENLEKELRKRFRAHPQRGKLIHKAGNKIRFDFEEIMSAPGEQKEAAARELEEMIAKLRG